MGVLKKTVASSGRQGGAEIFHWGGGVCLCCLVFGSAGLSIPCETEGTVDEGGLSLFWMMKKRRWGGGGLGGLNVEKVIMVIDWVVQVISNGWLTAAVIFLTGASMEM